MSRSAAFALIVGLVASATTGAPAFAQATASGPPAWMTGGYRGAATATSQTFDPVTRDANGNRVVVNGEIQSPGGTSVAMDFSSLSGGAGNTATGAGYSTATAIGNLLNVQVNGSWNTVVVNSTQTNSGNVSAQAGASTKAGSNGSH
jgi:holdfast attachment protein HfaA